MPRKIEVSHRTIIFTALLVLSGWVLYQVKDIILLIFISIILMSALKPAVDKLEGWKFPRSLAILLLYIVLWVVIGGFIAGLVPGLIDQTTRLIKVLPNAINNIQFLTDHQQDINQQLVSRLGTLPSAILKFVFDLFGNLINVLTASVITFYLLLERKKLSGYLEPYLGESDTEKISQIVSKVENRLGRWVRGELILMLVIGVFTYFGLLILGVEMALPLAILAGFMEIIPNLGPIISSVPAILIALMANPLSALGTVILYILVHFSENNFITPKIMQKAVGVSPLVSIISLMTGFKLAGSIGAVLAIPVIITIQSVSHEIVESVKNRE